MFSRTAEKEGGGNREDGNPDQTPDSSPHQSPGHLPYWAKEDFEIPEGPSRGVGAAEEGWRGDHLILILFQAEGFGWNIPPQF